MLKKSFILLSVLLLVVGILAGCSSTAQDGKSEVNEKEIYPLTIQDDTGTLVTINSEPKRIISLIPSHTESLFALGLEGKVVAVTKYANYPENVQELVEYVFEDGLNPNAEQILNLNPDLIILGSHSDEVLENIRNLNIPALKFSPESTFAVYLTIENLGMVTNTTEKAKELIDSMKMKENEIIEKVANIASDDKVRVWVEISSDLWTSGKGTFIDELVTKAGGQNIVEDQGWIQYSEEKVIDHNPQVILTTYGYYDPTAVENVLTREGWTQLDALKNKRVIDVNNDLISRPGPRIIDGLEEIAKALYPDLF